MARVVVLTGASAGIGAEAAVVLARRGDRLVLLGRDPAKLDGVVSRIHADSGRSVDSRVCDFAVLSDVRRAAAALAADYPRIDVLANNAGLISGRRQDTVDGHELTVQVNHLAPFLLTTALLDNLRDTPGARIVTTSSAAHTAGRLDPADLDFRRRRWLRWRAYADSKQANVLFTAELTWRLRDTDVVATCFHPGAVRSDFGDHSPLFRLAKRLAPIGFVSPSQGADPLVRLATGPEGRDIPGGYFDGAQLARPAGRAVDPELAARLWTVSQDLTAA